MSAPAAVLLLMTNLLPAGTSFYAKADLSYDPTLIGTFRYPKTKENIIVSKGGMASYRVVMSDRTGETAFDAKLFNLAVDGRERPVRFLDLTPAPEPLRPSYRFPAAASHLAVRVDWDDGELRLAAVDRRWLDSTLKEEDMPLVGTALTQDVEGLQKLLAWAVAEDRFVKPLIFERR